MRDELFMDRTVFEGNRTFGLFHTWLPENQIFGGWATLNEKIFPGEDPRTPRPHPSTTPKEGGWYATADIWPIREVSQPSVFIQYKQVSFHREQHLFLILDPAEVNNRVIDTQQNRPNLNMSR